MTDKSMSAELLGAGLQIAIGVAIPAITSAIAGGTPAEIVGGALVAASHDVAIRRVEARTHEHVHPLVSAAVRIEDIAADVRAEERRSAPDPEGSLASHLEQAARALRRRAAALAPTEPAPASGADGT